MRRADAGIRVGRLYADVLFDLALEGEVLDPVHRDLDLIEQLLAGEPDLRSFIESPYFVSDTKNELIRKTLQGRVQDLTARFLEAVVRHGRTAFLPDIFDRFRDLVRTHSGRCEVTVTVARALTQDQRDRLTGDLSGILAATVDLKEAVDPAILGGAVFRYNGRMVDNSVRGRLQRTVRDIMQRKG